VLSKLYTFWERIKWQKKYSVINSILRVFDVKSDVGLISSRMKFFNQSTSNLSNTNQTSQTKVIQKV